MWKQLKQTDHCDAAHFTNFLWQTTIIKCFYHELLQPRTIFILLWIHLQLTSAQIFYSVWLKQQQHRLLFIWHIIHFSLCYMHNFIVFFQKYMRKVFATQCQQSQINSKIMCNRKHRICFVECCFAIYLFLKKKLVVNSKT